MLKRTELREIEVGRDNNYSYIINKTKFMEVGSPPKLKSRGIRAPTM